MPKKPKTFVFDGRLLNAFRKEAGFELREGLLFATYWGSKAHNTYMRPGKRQGFDDTDVFCVLSSEGGPWRVQLDDWDLHAIELHSFIELAKVDPSVLGVLWTRPEDHLAKSETLTKLIEARDAFSSQAVLMALRNQARVIDKLEQPVEGFLSEYRNKFYAKTHFNTHLAGHMIRLLKMTIDFAKTGQLVVFREDDGDLIKGTKRGYFQAHEVLVMARRLAKEADEAIAVSTLPPQHNQERIDQLLTEIT